MAAKTKTIKTTVTIHAYDAKNAVPFEFNANTGAFVGKLAVIEYKPGEPVTLAADEADAILARFGGEEVADAAPASIVDPNAGQDPNLLAPATGGKAK